MRRVHTQQSPLAEEFLQKFHISIVEEVQEAVSSHDVVVIGMFLNPHVIMARRALTASNISYHYLQYGGYLSQWKQRLAIKMWSGWPTFPQVFVKGVLIGGNTRTQKALKTGYLQELLGKADSDSR